MNNNLINQLLKIETPSLSYRILSELFDYEPTHPDVLALKTQISDSKSVKKILNKMHPDGYWLQTNPRTKKIVGDGVEYGSFASTHFCLSYLSELGLTREHPLVEKAANRYLNLQKENGDFWNNMSCLTGYNIRTFIKLGFRDDTRLQKSIDLLLATERKDGGYLCEMHEKKSKNKKSCIRGAAKVLLAFSELPEYWDHLRCKQLIDYFLKRNGVYNSKLTEFANRDMGVFSFPITWGTSSWEILLALSKMGYGKDERLVDAWKLIEKKQLQNGFYPLDSTPAQSIWKVGGKGEGNPWVTFYVLLAKKFHDEVSR
jgi:hypothetical protein